LPRLLAAILIFLPVLAHAQPARLSHCIAIAGLDGGPERMFRANYRQALDKYEMRVSYVGHSTFLIQTEGGVSVATDFTGTLGPAGLVPDVVTMNHAHSSHWTPFVPPEVKHILPGWGESFGARIEHSLEIGEMLIRNVQTDIRRDFSTEPNGNSIFIFEVDGLCIGHLGHLHHEPDEAQYAAIGRVDVLMAAVDGGLTLDTPTMIRIAKRLKSSVVIPMHWFGRGALDGFLRGMSDEFDIVEAGESFVELSLTTLPERPTVIVLEPRLLD